jgi:hypothetical protein
MHGRVMDFLKGAKHMHPGAFRGKIIEFGAYNINGSVRDLCEADEYVGVDWRPGPGVDVVCLAHDYRERPEGYFPTAVATQMLEHDPHWRLTLARMVTLVKPGGYVILTWAGPGWEAHEMDTPPERGYYRNLEMHEVRGYLKLLGAWREELSEVHGDPPDRFWMGIGRKLLQV